VTIAGPPFGAAKTIDEAKQRFKEGVDRIQEQGRTEMH